jgi:hypothetical protein
VGGLNETQPQNRLPMKTPALPRSWPTVISLVVVLCLLLPAGRAADKTATPKKAALSAGPETEGYDLWIAEEVFLYRGKKLEPTLGNVVDALRERYADANIALAPGLAAVKISDLKLRAGQLSDELEAIRVASGSKFEWIAPGSAGPNLPPGSSVIDPATGLPSPSAESLNRGLFILREAPPTPWTERTVEAFNLSGYIQWLTNKDRTAAAPDSRAKAAEQSLHDVEKIVMETIETLKRGNLDSQDQPRFQFHSGANLLVTVGTRESVEIVRKVVNALPGQVEAGSPNPGGFGGVGGPTPNQAVNAFMQRYGLSAPPAPGAPGTAPR